MSNYFFFDKNIDITEEEGFLQKSRQEWNREVYTRSCNGKCQLLHKSILEEWPLQPKKGYKLLLTVP